MSIIAVPTRSGVAVVPAPYGTGASGHDGNPGLSNNAFATRTAMASYAPGGGLNVKDNFYLSEPGREGWFVVDLASSWTALIATDSVQQNFVASTFDATKVYRRVGHPPIVKHAGTAGDDSADDASEIQAAFDNAQAAAINYTPSGLLTGYGIGGGEVRLTKAKPAYKTASPLDMKSTLVLRGETTGGAGGFGTIIHAAPNINVLRVQAINTENDTDTFTPVVSSGGQGSIVDGIAIIGDYNGTTNTDDLAGGSNALLLRAQGLIKNFQAWRMQGAGIRIRAGWSDPEKGGANFWHIDTALLQDCLDGINISGVDTNQGLLENAFIVDARRWGAIDFSIGAQYRNCLFQGCGVVPTNDGSTAGKPTPVVKYLGNFFVVKYGRETPGSTTAPPATASDDVNFYFWKPDNGDGWPTWVSGIYLRAGGAIYAPNGAVLDFSYFEGNVPGQLSGGAFVLGGLFDSTPFGSPPMITSANHEIRISSLRIFAGSIGMDDDVGGSLLVGRSSPGGPSIIRGTPAAAYTAFCAPDGSQHLYVTNSAVGVRNTIADATGFYPATDNAITLGKSGARWTELWAASATIQTSDRAHKSHIRKLDTKRFDALLDAVGSVPLVAYKMKDAVKAKGKKARDHYGIIAQDLHAALERHGLDPFLGGMLGRDKVIEKYEVEVEVEREATFTTFLTKEKVEIVDGKAVLRTEQVETQRPLVDEVPVVDGKGEPVMLIARPAGTLSEADPGAPARPRLHQVRRMETVKVKEKRERVKLDNHGNEEWIWNVRYSEFFTLRQAWMERELGRRAVIA